jgi:large subunit ribosomal protein L4
MPNLPLYNSKGEATEKMELPENVFDGRVNRELLHQVVVMYQANQRQGTACVKVRGEVSGGGRKPWRQKGTGRARVGSNRSPLWRHGGVTFGPQARDFSYTLPAKIRRQALLSSINDKMSADGLLLVDHLEIKSPKTKELASILSALKIQEKTLLVIDDKERNERIVKAARNIPFVTLLRAGDINALDVMENRKVLLTRLATKALIQRLK